MLRAACTVDGKRREEVLSSMTFLENQDLNQKLDANKKELWATGN